MSCDLAGDVLTQLTCRPINATVLPALAFDNETKSSLLPLVEYGRTQAGKPRIGQLVSPNFIIQGEHRIINIITQGELFSFKDIRDSFFSVKDFCRYTSSCVETHNGLTDLNSLLASIAHTAVDRDKLQHAIFSLQASKVYDANFFFSVVTNSVRHFARRTFLLALEKLSTPFITIMFILIQILTTMWILVFTLKCLKKISSKIVVMCNFFCVCVLFYHTVAYFIAVILMHA